MKDDSAGLVDLVGSYAIRPLVGVQRVAHIHGVLASRDRLVCAAGGHFGKLLAKRDAWSAVWRSHQRLRLGEAPRREGQSKRATLTLSRWREIANATFVVFVFKPVGCDKMYQLIGLVTDVTKRKTMLEPHIPTTCVSQRTLSH